MKKRFDCVELQHQAGEEIRDITRNMTVKEEAAYWRNRTTALRNKRETLRRKGRSASSA
ncbi:MAG: hypothetical protein WC975_15430 [Phycisphaerae bacterium]